jgi:arylsulfatase A-like enzyme
VKQPNVIFVFSDQHRADATGYAGNPDVQTAHLDRLAKQSINFKLAVSNMPVCSPYRATLMTGQYPLTHGLFINDKPLQTKQTCLAEAFKAADYDTAYVGKWHLNGKGRKAVIPREERLGFDYWRGLECTHTYNESYYYQDDEQSLRQWEGYDAEAQTKCAIDYINGRKHEEKPFFLVLSWGPPHDPYQTAPEQFKQLYDATKLTLRPNVPQEKEEQARKALAGYYAHITALDTYVGWLLKTLKDNNLEEETIFVYASDHGDMIFSQDEVLKQKPWDESIRVPFLLRYPGVFGWSGREIMQPFNSPDIMPTLLGLCHIKIPGAVEGGNYAPFLRGEERLDVEAALIQSVIPFATWTRERGGREYRGIRTQRYTYVKDLNGPWLLYDNERDPYQLTNLCHDSSYQEVANQLESILQDMLKERGDEFLHGDMYAERWGYLNDISKLYEL